jgi:L-ascorbate metabolism protein UlaG (beta-lactamase superfamily)
VRVSKYIHSCLLVEKGQDKILFDPGKFSFVEGLVKPGQFENLAAVILTHYHPDHIDENALKIILENNPGADLFCNEEIKDKLAEKGIESNVFEKGERAIREFSVEAMDASHAAILGSIPPQNTAYIVDGIFLTPGDSFAPGLEERRGVQILALPVMAPWTTELAVAALAERMSPRLVVPIHDGFVKDFFLKQRYENFEKYFSKQGIEFRPLVGPGDSVEIEST